MGHLGWHSREIIFQIHPTLLGIHHRNGLIYGIVEYLNAFAV